MRETNQEPLLINTVNSLKHRPAASTKIPNLMLAADYVNTYTNLACMEGANEAGRRAANAILDATAFKGQRCRLWPYKAPPIFEFAQRIDLLLWKLTHKSASQLIRNLLPAMSIDSVRRYYEECHVDYRIVWRLKQNLFIHFGYFDETCQEHAAALENMNREMLKRTSISASDRVLDAGCGVGGCSFWIAKQTRAMVTGINIQPLHLELARARMRPTRSEADRASFENRDYCDTGFDMESFDVVLGPGERLPLRRQTAIPLREAFRLLRPGGRLIVGDFIQLRQNLSRAQTREMAIWLDGWAIPHLTGFGQFRKWIAQAGFIDVAAENITPNVLRSSRRLFKASLIVLPFSGLATLMGWRTPLADGECPGELLPVQNDRRGMLGLRHLLCCQA